MNTLSFFNAYTPADTRLSISPAISLTPTPPHFRPDIQSP